MDTLTIRNVTNDPLELRHWTGSTVDPGDTVQVTAEVVDRLPDAVVVATDWGQDYALPLSRWAVEGDDGDTIRDVLRRVGGDPDRAAAELAAETDPDTGRNRVSLVPQLKRIAAGAGPAPVLAELSAQAMREKIRDGALHGVDFAPGTATADNPLGLYAPGTDKED